MIIFVLLSTFTFICSANNEINYALNKVTQQSSVSEGGLSLRAVDGYKNPYYSQKSCMQTKPQYQPWWMVDLAEEIYVTSVRIVNRKDCCAERLTNFDVRVGNVNKDGGIANTLCSSTFKYKIAAGATQEIKCLAPVLGRYVTVAIVKNGGTLNFCEVQVFGERKDDVIHVKAVSFGKSDYMKSPRNPSYYTINGRLQKELNTRGHFIYAYDLRTGSLVQTSKFNTMYDRASMTAMPAALSSLPSEVFVVVLMNILGHMYYRPSIPLLKELSGATSITSSLTYSDAWALLGYKGTLFKSPRWRQSVIKRKNYGPAVVNTVVPKLKPPAEAPADVTVIHVTSDVITLSWTRPVNLRSDDEMPATYMFCIGKVGEQSKCSNVQDKLSHSASDLEATTKYNVGVRVVTGVGQGPLKSITVTTLATGTFKMFVELVSRVEEDVLYRRDGKPYSSITIAGAETRFTTYGHHFMVLDAKTGNKDSQMSFNTYKDPGSDDKMATFLNGIPENKVILMVVYHRAHDYYKNSATVMKDICPEAPLAYGTKSSWSMACLKGLSRPPWAQSKISSSLVGPAVLKAHILSAKELEEAPKITYSNAIGPTRIVIKWQKPVTDEHTGDIAGYEIFYQVMDETKDISTLEIDDGKLEQVVLQDLKPFFEYKIKIKAFVSWNYGPYSDMVSVKMVESEPSAGPSKVTFPDVRSTTMIVNWQPPLLEFRNGHITKYTLCFQDEEDRRPCEPVHQLPADQTEFEATGLKPFVRYKFIIKASTKIGFGPATIAVQETISEAPKGPPLALRVTNVTSTNITLTWSLPKLELRNGQIINHKICARILETGPCDEELWISNDTSCRVADLAPNTEYYLNVAAATQGGVGPFAVVTGKTLEAEPSGPPVDFHVTSVNQSDMMISWSMPAPLDRNGIITKYFVCIKPPSYENCQQKKVLPATELSHVFYKLLPYVNYTVGVKAATAIGYGPNAWLTQRTEEAAPSGAPTMPKVVFMNSTSINFTWMPPEPWMRNGIIEMYRICLRQYGGPGGCTQNVAQHVSVTHRAFHNLSPNKEYVISIAAATVAGLGPPTFVQKTSGTCDLPVLRSDGVVVDDSFTASGYLGDNYEPYHARFDSQLPWCEKGTRSDVFLQVDLGTELRLLGVATKGHKRHWNSWVSSYRLLTSLDSVQWRNEMVAGDKLLHGNTRDGEYGVVNYFDMPVMAQFVRFEVVSFVGLHPCMRVEVIGCAAASRPKYARVYKASANSISIQWRKVIDDTKNGKIHGYRICHKESSTSSPCQQRGYVPWYRTWYHVVGLRPFTEYKIELSRGTIAGYGKPAVLVYTTLPTAPSGPPFAIMAKDVTATTANLVWSLPLKEHRNGIISQYAICYQMASLRTDCHNTTVVNGTEHSLMIDNLRPNMEYILQVKAATVEGWGPPGAVNQRTLSSAPSGTPTGVSITQLGATALQISWSAPVAEEQNGRLTGYRVCFMHAEDGSPCQNFVSLPDDQTAYSVSNLKPNTEYLLHIQARNVKGIGPAYTTTHKTGQSVPIAPPRNVAVRSDNSTSIELKWDPPEVGKRNGDITSYEITVFREATAGKVEKRASMVLKGEETYWADTNLLSDTGYIFHIKAGTIKGFGPPVIVHKRTAAEENAIVDSSASKGTQLTSGGIAGGTLLVIVLLLALACSLLWNKGILQKTGLFGKTRVTHLEKKRRRRRRKHKRRKRRKKRKKDEGKTETSPGVEIHGTESVFSELHDYDAEPEAPPAGATPTSAVSKAMKPVTADDLYDDQECLVEEIHDTVALVADQLIYDDDLPNLHGKVTDDLYKFLPSVCMRDHAVSGKKSDADGTKSVETIRKKTVIPRQRSVEPRELGEVVRDVEHPDDADFAGAFPEQRFTVPTRRPEPVPLSLSLPRPVGAGIAQNYFPTDTHQSIYSGKRKAGDSVPMPVAQGRPTSPAGGFPGVQSNSGYNAATRLNNLVMSSPPDHQDFRNNPRNPTNF